MLNVARRASHAAITLLCVLGAASMAVLPASAEPFAFVANLNSETVSVIDTATNSVTDTIPVGSAIRPSMITATPDGRLVYVTDFELRTVTAIDSASNTVRARIALGDPTSFDYAPTGIAITPDSRRAYVTEDNGRLGIIDTATNQIISNEPLRFDGAIIAGKLVLSADGRRGYVVGYTVRNGYFDRYAVARLDTASNSVDALMPMDTGAAGIALSPDGATLYVGLSDAVALIDTTTLQVTSRINVGLNPLLVAVTPDGRQLYMVDVGSGHLAALDVSTGGVTPIAVLDSYRATSLTMAPDGHHAYVTYSTFISSGMLAAIDTTTNTVSDTISFGPRVSPVGLAVMPDGVRAYLATQFTVQTLDLATHDTQTILLATWPEWVAATPDGAFAYVASEMTDVLSVIDRAAGRVTATVRLPGAASHVAITPDGRFAYVSMTQTVRPGIAIVDTRTNVLETVIAIDPFSTFGPIAGATAFTPDGRQVYVASSNQGVFERPDLVSVIDTASRTVTATIPVNEPDYIAMAPSGCFAYVAAPPTIWFDPPVQLPNRLDIIDTATNTVNGLIALGGQVDFLTRIVVAPDGSVAYVLTAGDYQSLLEIADLRTSTVTGVIPDVGDIRELVLSADGKTLYATSRSAGGVIAIDTATGARTATIATGFYPIGIALPQAAENTTLPTCMPASTPTTTPTHTASATLTPPPTATPTVTRTLRPPATATRTPTKTVTAMSTPTTIAPTATRTVVLVPSSTPTAPRMPDGGGCALAPLQPGASDAAQLLLLPAVLAWRRYRHRAR